MNLLFKVERYNHITKITNLSEEVLLISSIPSPPKRKYWDLMAIPPGEFRICDYEIDLTKTSFRLKNKQEEIK